MAIEGYQYADPHEAYAKFVNSSDGYRHEFRQIRSKLEADEIRQAVAAATCKEKVGFWEVVAVAEAKVAVSGSR